MNKVVKAVAIGATVSLLSACGSDGTSSSGGGADKDASNCVTRTLRTIYTNDCEFDVNAVIFEIGATPFHINANRGVTRSASGNRFGACRAPSMPILNGDASNFSCS